MGCFGRVTMNACIHR